MLNAAVEQQLFKLCQTSSLLCSDCFKKRPKRDIFYITFSWDQTKTAAALQKARSASWDFDSGYIHMHMCAHTHKQFGQVTNIINKHIKETDRWTQEEVRTMETDGCGE